MWRWDGSNLGVPVQGSSAWIRFGCMGDGEGKETPHKTKEVGWAQSTGHSLYLGMLCTMVWVCVNPKIHLWKLGVKVLGHRALRRQLGHDSGALTSGIVSLRGIWSSSQLFQLCDPEQGPFQNLVMLAPGLRILPRELRKVFLLFTTHSVYFVTPGALVCFLIPSHISTDEVIYKQ